MYRYIVHEIEWVAADGRKISKTCLIGYAPDEGNKEDKVAVSAHLAAFKDGLEKPVSDARQLNSFEELTEDTLKSWFKE